MSRQISPSETSLPPPPRMRKRRGSRSSTNVHFETLESRTLLSADPLGLGLAQALMPANYEFQAVISAALEHIGSVSSETRNDIASPKGGDVEITTSSSARAGDSSFNAKTGGTEKADEGKNADRTIKPDVRQEVSGSQSQQSHFLAVFLDAVAERSDRSFDNRFGIVLPVSIFAREPSSLFHATSSVSGIIASTKTLTTDRPAILAQTPDAQTGQGIFAVGAVEVTAFLGDDGAPAALPATSLPGLPLSGLLPAIARTDNGPGDTGAALVAGAAISVQNDGLPSPAPQASSHVRVAVEGSTSTVHAGPAEPPGLNPVTTAYAQLGARYRDNSLIVERVASPGRLSTEERTGRTDAVPNADDAFDTLSALAGTARHETDDTKAPLHLSNLGYPQPLRTLDQNADTSLHALVAVAATVSIAAALHTNERRRRDSRAEKTSR